MENLKKIELYDSKGCSHEIQVMTGDDFSINLEDLDAVIPGNINQCDKLRFVVIKNSRVVGTLDLISSSSGSVVTQIFTTYASLNADGTLTGTDTGIASQYYRTYSSGTWSRWHALAFDSISGDTTHSPSCKAVYDFVTDETEQFMDISELDSLTAKSLVFLSAGRKKQRRIVMKDAESAFGVNREAMGVLDIISCPDREEEDGSFSKVMTQILMTHYVAREGELQTNEYDEEKVFQYFRNVVYNSASGEIIFGNWQPVVPEVKIPEVNTVPGGKIHYSGEKIIMVVDGIFTYVEFEEGSRITYLSDTYPFVHSEIGFSGNNRKFFFIYDRTNAPSCAMVYALDTAANAVHERVREAFPDANGTTMAANILETDIVLFALDVPAVPVGLLGNCLELLDSIPSAASVMSARSKSRAANAVSDESAEDDAEIESLLANIPEELKDEGRAALKRMLARIKDAEQ